MRVSRGHRPGSATPLAVRQVTPLNSHPAALPGRLVDIALTCPPVADCQVQPGGRCLRRVHRTGNVITCPVTYLVLSCNRCLCYRACGSLRPHNAAVRRPVMLWRRQPLTSRGPLASSGRHNRARVAHGYIPRPTTPRCALCGRFSPFDSHPRRPPRAASMFSLAPATSDGSPAPLYLSFPLSLSAPNGT